VLAMRIEAQAERHCRADWQTLWARRWLIVATILAAVGTGQAAGGVEWRQKCQLSAQARKAWRFWLRLAIQTEQVASSKRDICVENDELRNVARSRTLDGRTSDENQQLHDYFAFDDACSSLRKFHCIRVDKDATWRVKQVDQSLVRSTLEVLRRNGLPELNF